MKSFSILGAGFLAFVGSAQASCLDSPSTPDCIEPEVDAGTTQTISPTFPNPSPSCKKVANACTFNVAVPVASQEEWGSFVQSEFVNTAGSCVSLSDCATKTDGACAAFTRVYTGYYNNTFEELPRFGCASPAPATNTYQAPRPSGRHLPWEMGRFPYSTWDCPGTNGGTTASCRCKEFGSAYFLVVGPFPINNTFIVCVPR